MESKIIIEVDEFRVITNKIKDIYYNAAERLQEEALSEEEADKAEKELMSLCKELENYDFSKIPKEEWAGMLIGEFIDLSFSNAKLDYSLFNFEDMPGVGDLRGCEVTNFPFETSFYSENNFDDEFIDKNREYFIPKDAPEDLRDRFYSKELLPSDIANYSDILSGKKMDNRIDYRFRGIINNVGQEKALKVFEMEPQLCESLEKVRLLNNCVGEIEKLESQDIDISEIISVLENEAVKALETRSIPGYVFENISSDEIFGLRFRSEHSELFLPQEAPEELKQKFFSKEITFDDIDKYKELLKDMGIDNSISFHNENSVYYNLAEVFGKDDFMKLYLENSSAAKQLAEMANDEYRFKSIKSYPSDMTMEQKIETLLNASYSKLMNAWGKEFIFTALEEIENAGEILKVVDNVGWRIGSASNELAREFDNGEMSSEEVQDSIFKDLRTSIIRGAKYREDINNDFKNRFPELFLPIDAPEGLKESFYNERPSDRKGYLTLSQLQENPEWVPFLKDVDKERVFNLPTRYLANLISMDTLIHFGVLYGNTVDELVKQYNVGDNQYHVIERYNKFADEIANLDLNSGEAHKVFRKFLYNIISPEVIIERPSERLRYDENVPQIFKDEHPELFLSKGAPELLKQKFYHLNLDESKREDYYLSFKDLKSNPEWSEYLKQKNIQVGLPEGYSKFFEIFGLEAGSKVGLRQGESVDILIRSKKEELMKLWIDKCKFLPHHVVVTNYPTDEIDKFIANSKRWSQLMKLDKYNARDDDKLAILKAGMVMGVFEEKDKTGVNKLLELVTRVPMTISQEEFNKCMEKDPKLSRQVFTETKEGRYGLKVDSKEKEIYKQVHNLLEKIDHPYIMTVEKAQLIFNAMDMKFKPEFKKFLLDNIDHIISNSEVQNYIGQLQKRFEGFEQEYQNKKIWSLELALRYLNDTKYDKVKPGSEKLADLSKKWGYSQEEFEFLQKVYIQGKKRKASSIPRIQGNHKEYSFEMLRLDDAYPLVIGPETECCQRLDDAGESCMLHSMIEKNGRLFVLKDNEGKIVAQSWVWRNKNVICFDNIEIPKWIKKSDPEIESKVLEVYQKATLQIREEEHQKIKTLVDEGLIGLKQAEEQLVRKITVGVGYTDVELESFEKDSEAVKPKEADKMYEKYKGKGELYTNDSRTQYILYKDEKYDSIDTTESKTVARYTDELKIYENSQINDNLIYSLRRLEKESYSEEPELAPLNDAFKVRDMADAYGLDEKKMKVAKGVDWFMVYEENDKDIKIGAVNRVKEYSTKVILEMAEAIKMLVDTGKELAVTTKDESIQKLLYFYANKDKLNLLESKETYRFGSKFSEIKVIKKKEQERVDEFGGR